VQDAENTLIETQRGTLDYLLAVENGEAVEKILADPDVRIGSAFIYAIASNPSLDSILVIFDESVAYRIVMQHPVPM
jgi:hypothetical protein